MGSKRARRSDVDEEDGSVTTATMATDDAFAARVGRVALTVQWISRTRGRSNESGDAPTCRDVKLAVTGATRAKRLIQNCVQLPPDANEHEVTLSWGRLILDPRERMHGTEEGGWSLDVFAETPVRLTLLVPNGTLLRHPSLVREARGKRSVPKVLMSDRDALKTDEVDDEELDAGANVTERSRRALHPGRTCDEGIASLMNDHNVIQRKSYNGAAIVDVGSGCGSLCAGLAKSFPNMRIFGIECQEELVRQAKVRFRDVNFIHGDAEEVLHTCRTAKVVVATTHNFDYETTNHILRVCAELPLLTHVVINEPHLCRPACRTKIKLCCCFEALETREIKTHWGNSKLSFTIYKRHVRWPYGQSALPRGDDTAVALMEGNVTEVILQPSNTASGDDERDEDSG
jgi:hypothetical protein